MNEQLIKHKGKHYLQREERYYQIYSSTDKLLGLPSPSKEFIVKYIENRNAGTPITDCMVEMITCDDIPQPLKSSTMGECRWITDNVGKPKINKEGNIIISRIEETWDDVEDQFKIDDWTDNTSIWDLFAWLRQNYTAPTKLTK